MLEVLTYHSLLGSAQHELGQGAEAGVRPWPGRDGNVIGGRVSMRWGVVIGGSVGCMTVAASQESWKPGWVEGLLGLHGKHGGSVLRKQGD